MSKEKMHVSNINHGHALRKSQYQVKKNRIWKIENIPHSRDGDVPKRNHRGEEEKWGKVKMTKKERKKGRKI